MKWHAGYDDALDGYYALRNIRIGSKKTKELLHRVILSRMLNKKLESYEQVDHKDLDSLNNCRENLRVSSSSQNNTNKSKQSNNKSGYKGVSWNKKAGKWESRIQVGDKYKYLGQFNDILDAAEMYKKAAVKYHGEFARW